MEKVLFETTIEIHMSSDLTFEKFTPVFGAAGIQGVPGAQRF